MLIKKIAKKVNSEDLNNVVENFNNLLKKESDDYNELIEKYNELEKKYKDLKQSLERTSPDYNISIDHGNLVFLDGYSENRYIEALKSHENQFVVCMIN